MEVSIDNTKWYDRVWAALIFFTRLPFWRIYQPKKEAYKTVVEHWALTGWLTGGCMATVSPDCSSLVLCMRMDLLISLMALVEGALTVSASSIS